PIVDRQRLDDARAVLEEFVQRHPGLLLEDKGHSLAVHFRRAPYLSADVYGVLRLVREDLGRRFTLQAAKCVFEIRPAGRSKGTSIAEFMTQRPFSRRTPIFVGDDLTDEEGFAVVNALGGVSIRVGAPSMTIAHHRLRNVSEVIQWLERVPSPAGLSI
ncbi:MAG: trehalose-phosphatase, partial [Lysobacterales bacterium]